MSLSLARVLRRARDVDFAQNLVRHFLCVVEVIDREAQAGRIERIEEVDVEVPTERDEGVDAALAGPRLSAG